MPASTLYSAHILPNRPAYIPKDQREDVVVGKSEWKKVSKWFKEVGKEGIVKVKESKGEVMVVSYVASDFPSTGDMLSSKIRRRGVSVKLRHQIRSYPCFHRRPQAVRHYRGR